MTPANFISAERIRTVLEGRSILVVEDEFLIAMELEISLEDVGAVPVLAGSVREAEEALEGETPAAAILDVRLPDGESFGIAAQLRERGVPFLFQSGHTLFDDLTPELEAPLLTKPVPPGRILTELAILLGAERAGG